MAGMNWSNGNSFAHNNGNSMCLGGGQSFGTDGTRPPSWWFTFPADPVWRV